ncbi:DUF1638 domain-containing protein [Tepidanaerobacter acetatoxydans]|uniref:DUF1638 domain-containing protein n=1 Tax=Tepidanaerobacter acetatoxydans TaxID=499229 RepID=UPI001BD31F4D
MDDVVIIACETIRYELNAAIKETGENIEVIWIDSRYHNDPDGLREKLQQEIDSIKDKKTILLGFGCCGNALVGIKATTADLIIPKTDDCISMMLSKEGEKFERIKKTYFLTKGWIESPKSLVVEYNRALEKYGEKKVQRIFNVMLKNYEYLMLIDTGCYEIDQCIDQTIEISEFTHLELIVNKGDIWLLKKLVTGPHDDDFCLIPKGEKVKIGHFGYIGIDASSKIRNII